MDEPQRETSATAAQLGRLTDPARRPLLRQLLDTYRFGLQRP